MEPNTRPTRAIPPERLADAARLKELLAEWKKKHGRSQTDAAKELGITQGALWQYANGRVALNLNMVLKAAKLLNVDPAEISPGIAEELRDLVPANAPRDERYDTFLRLAERDGIDRIAFATGMARGPYMRILSGQKAMSDGFARRFEESYAPQLEAGWLDRGELPASIPYVASVKADEQIKRTFTVPRYDTGGAMGFGVVLRDQPGIIESIEVSPEWLDQNVRNCTSKENLCVVTGFGDSMRPLFNPGDPLIVDRGVRSVDFDAIYFFRVDDEGFIKRLQRVPGKGLLAISENSAYRDWVIDSAMNFEVFGRVLKVWRSEDF